MEEYAYYLDILAVSCDSFRYNDYIPVTGRYRYLFCNPANLIKIGDLVCEVLSNLVLHKLFQGRDQRADRETGWQKGRDRNPFGATLLHM